MGTQAVTQATAQPSAAPPTQPPVRPAPPAHLPAAPHVAGPVPAGADSPEVRQARVAVAAVLAGVRYDGRGTLTAAEGKLVADAYGIATPAEGLALDVDEAVALTDRIGGPVVLRIVSPDIAHEPEAGGVEVGLETAAEVRAAFHRIITGATAYAPGARIDGVRVQQQLPPGQEVIVGAVTDPTFGKVVAFGLGGAPVEVLRDVTFRQAPITADEALTMLDSIKAAEILRGVRGGLPVDRWALAEQIRRVSRLVADFPEITKVDLNPVIATPEGALAGDIRIILAADEPDGIHPADEYDDLLREADVIAATGLADLLEPVGVLPVLPNPPGDNVVIIAGSGGSGALLSGACVAHGLTLMDIPRDLADAFGRYVPAFGSAGHPAGNPIGITGGETPATYEAVIRLGLDDPRVHALVLGYRHTLATPPMTFAELTVRAVERARAMGVEKPVVASLAGGTEVEEAAAYLFDHGVVAYPYSTEEPVAALSAAYRWSRAARQLD